MIDDAVLLFVSQSSQEGALTLDRGERYDVSNTNYSNEPLVRSRRCALVAHDNHTCAVRKLPLTHIGGTDQE